MTSEYKAFEQMKDLQIQEQQKLAKKIKNFIYDPSDVVGSGFSSKVYKGINQINNQQVAIKVIELSKIQNQVQKYLLNNQINALRALKHKNILRTVDILMTKNNVYIVTQFCEFGDLQQMIKNHNKINQKDALSILRDVIEGYIAIQQKNIIHRDIKTANIFLTKSGAKIADFGFCEFIGQKKPQISYNVGSPAYMSPQSYKQNLYSHKSDIWGIGIILYEMLIGETPEKNLTYTQMSTNLMNGKINCFSNEQSRKILISCFKKDIKQRIDAKNLLISVNVAIDLLNRIGAKDQQKHSRSPNFDPKILSSPHEGIQAMRNPIRQEKRSVLNYSPTKAFEIKRVDEPRYSSNIIHSNGNGKKDNVLATSGVVSRFKNNESDDFSKEIKAEIIMLQFIFRLFKHVIEISISSLTFLRLILFRHRIYISQIAQSLVENYKININNSQLYKQLQYLQMKFDEAYLEKQNSIISTDNNNQVMQTMNKLANINFNQHQSLSAYKQFLRKGCEEVQFQINKNRSNAYILWDYLLIQFQILTLYEEGLNNYSIVTERCLLQQILKKKPQTINKNHIELFRIKSQYLFDSMNVGEGYKLINK